MVKITIKKINLGKWFLIIIATVGISTGIYAQKVEDVTLTVSGEGTNKEEATKIALRSAIEQAFGVFVSANTTILDDELVKDEIATISSGNIKKYDEIARATLPNGNTTITLKAIVSVSKLITYAQSKGSSSEFAGATFGLNMKLKELNKANEEKAIENMISQLEALAPMMFDYKLNLKEPKVGENDTYIIPATVDVIYNDNTETAISILLNTLSSISLSDEEENEYKTLNLRTYPFIIGSKYAVGYGHTKIEDEKDFYLRSDKSQQLLIQYVHIFNDIVENFQIVDNTNNISTIEEDEEIGYKYSGLISMAEEFGLWVRYYPPSDYVEEFASKGRAHYLLKTGCVLIPYISKEYLPKNGRCYRIEIEMSIPKEDISRYSNFTISRKEK
jgi:hypothetical protein